ncbi:DUF5683 domain-containing protein [Maribacter sp. X9]|uniref:DUF5683 domain-containing protein n=1 Tax=Maribacter sp. X9 TaxID=3402159 RepID=UPI003AF39BD4
MLLLSINFCFSQEEEESVAPSKKDSIQSSIEEEVIIIEDSLLVEKKAFNPLAPSKAAFYSAILPGLGQIYNKRYWKLPIVWGAIGGSVYMYTWNNDNYQQFRTAFKRRQAGFTDDKFYDINGDNAAGADPDLDLEDLEYQQERFQRDRDLWLVVSIGMYALNIIDANVDAHLQQFNIDDDLSIDFKPYFDLNQVTNTPNYGMALTFKF